MGLIYLDSTRVHKVQSHALLGWEPGGAHTRGAVKGGGGYIAACRSKGE